MNENEFKSAVSLAVKLLNERGISIAGGESGATAFEVDVCKALQDSVRQIGLSAQPVHVGGRRFPDIFFEGTRFGVEVKTSRQGWHCLGNSVLASTRIDGVDRIELVFGSGSTPAVVRSADYKDCVASVEVTHSPRYVLDMNLNHGDGYFSKAHFTFEEILNASDPISLVVEEAKSRMSEGEWLWWMGERPGASSATPLVIKKWGVLSKQERERLIGRALALFPEALKPSRADYDRVALWLVTENSVVNSSLRDVFSAGGTHDFQIPMGCLERAPRVLYSLSSNLPMVIDAIRNTSPEEWARWYGVALKECSTPAQRLEAWKNVVRPMLQAHALKCLEGAERYKINCINSYLDSVEL